MNGPKKNPAQTAKAEIGSDGLLFLDVLITIGDELHGLEAVFDGRKEQFFGMMEWVKEDGMEKVGKVLSGCALNIM